MLWKYDKEREIIHFRHYIIYLQGTGINKAVQSLLRAANEGKHVPNLGRYNDISDFILRYVDHGISLCSGNDNREGDNYNVVEGLKTGTNFPQTKVNLYESGPRMDLRLIKIQEGCTNGKVLYHALGKQ